MNKVEVEEIKLYNEEEFKSWKKIEIEILRDKNGNCICIGSREFINSEISVIPVLTVPNAYFQILRSEAIHYATNLKVLGNINFYFVINLEKFDYKLINYVVNDKNTIIENCAEYPIKEVIPQINNGKMLDQINLENCCQETSFKNVFVIIGDVIVSNNSLEGAIFKASCISNSLGDFFRLNELVELEKNDIEFLLEKNNSDIFLIIAEAIRKEISVEKIKEITKIDKYFIGSVYKIIKIERELALNFVDIRLIEKAMNYGMSLKTIAFLSGQEENSLEKIISKKRM